MGHNQSKNENVLHVAVKKRDVSTVRSVLTAKPMLKDSKTHDGATALHIAASECDVEVVKALLEVKADLNIPDAQGKLPLHIAAAHGTEGAVKLLATPNNINTTDKTKMTPLSCAIKSNQFPVAKYLIEAKADVNVASEDGSPLALVIQQSNVEAAKLLLNSKANPDITNSNGETPLYLLTTKKLPYREALLPATSDRGPVLEKKTNPLIEILVEAKANVGIGDSENKTPLMRAALRGDAVVTRTLLEGKVDQKALDAQDAEGRTAVYYAATGGDPGEDVDFDATLKLLLEAKGSGNLADNEGDSPLITAARTGRIEALKLLLLWGHADANHKNKEGRTALAISYLTDQKEAHKLLKNETAQDDDWITGVGGRSNAKFVKQFGDGDAGRPPPSGGPSS